MHSPIFAFTWGIWRRKHRLVWLLTAIVLCALLLNVWTPDSIREKSHDRFASGTALLFGLLNQSFIAASLLLILAIFSYTEFNPQTDSIAFLHRLFVLPVTSF